MSENKNIQYDKFTWHAGETEIVTNDSLVCRNCIFREINAGNCEIYPYPDGKPTDIMFGSECNYKEEI